MIKSKGTLLLLLLTLCLIMASTTKAALAPTPTMYDVAGVYNGTSVTSLSVASVGSTKWTSLLVCTISALDSNNGTISCTQPNYGYLNTAALQIISKGKKMTWTLDGPALSQMENIITDDLASWAANSGSYLDTSSAYYDIQTMTSTPIGIVKNKKGTFPTTGTLTIKGFVTGLVDSYSYTRKFSYTTKITFHQKLN